ncbi:MAG: hypothetical protein NW207_11445 [Cytophagales bacterium]|nr:hypothetical protein [Cytophagales bacterium]
MGIVPKRLLLFFIAAFLVVDARSQQLQLGGAYQGKNLYVQNPFTTDMKDFCTNEVYVNDQLVMSDIKSSAFEIDLSSFKLNDPLNIKITYKEGCRPKVLNSQVIRLNSTFQFSNVVVDDKIINWTTKGEKSGDKCYVEQFLYNNWVILKEIPAKGSSSSNNYNFDEHHHAGLNKYRIKFVERDGNVFYSKVVEYQSKKSEVTFYPKRVSNKIYLSRDTEYEIVDGYGNPVQKGKGKEIGCESLKEGIYYLNVDNKTEKFLKK